MANGRAPDGAIQEQIEDSIKDAIASARARMPSGEAREASRTSGANGGGQASAGL